MTISRVLTYVVLVVWAVICIFPLYWVAITSFKDVLIIDQAPRCLPFVDFMPSLDAWRFILLDHNENLVSRAVNSAIIGLCATLATLVLGGMLVYGVTRLMTKHKGTAVVALVLTTRILPPVAIVLPLYIMAQVSGTRDSLGILIFVYTAINLPIAVWLLMPVFGSRATEQEEAAQLDGASHIYVFFGILLPMMRGAMITVGFLVFLQCWNEYFFAVFLTADNALTIPPWMVGQLSMKEAQIGGEAEEWAHLSAATIVMALPALVFTLFAQKSLGRSFLQRR
jgi:multiple sugar transport system permease protein